MTRALLQQFTGFLAALCLCASAAATPIYDNFGPADDYDGTSGFLVTASAGTAMQFTATSSGFANSLDVGMTAFLSDSDMHVQLSLFSDDLGSIDGLLDQTTVLVQPGSTFASEPVVNGLLSGTAFMNAGQQYWLVATNLSDGFAAWGQNSTGATGLTMTAHPTAFHGALAAFRVTASQVPEPASALLLLAGLACLKARRERRRLSVIQR